MHAQAPTCPNPPRPRSHLRPIPLAEPARTFPTEAKGAAHSGWPPATETGPVGAAPPGLGCVITGPSVCLSRSAAGRIEPRRSDVGLVAQRDRLPRRDRADGERLTAAAVAVAVAPAAAPALAGVVLRGRAAVLCTGDDQLERKPNVLTRRESPTRISQRPPIPVAQLYSTALAAPAKPMGAIGTPFRSLRRSHGDSLSLGSTPSASRCPHRPGPIDRLGPRPLVEA